MALLTGLLMGTAAGLSLVTISLLAFRKKKEHFVSYKTPVTEILQVNLVDTRIKMTDIDTLEGNSILPSRKPSAIFS